MCLKSELFQSDSDSFVKCLKSELTKVWISDINCIYLEGKFNSGKGELIFTSVPFTGQNPQICEQCGGAYNLTNFVKEVQSRTLSI